MDGGAGPGLATRDAVVEVAYSVGALVNSVQHLTRAVEALRRALGPGGPGLDEVAAEVDAALVQAKSTSDASIAAAVQVLRAFGERAPHER